MRAAKCWVAVGLVLALGACGRKSSGEGSRVPGKPVETRSPEAPDQKPAFAGQTRAPFNTANVAFDVQTVASGLEHPWGIAFLPDGRMLVTERPGRLRVVTAQGAKSEPVQGVPKVYAREQGGLLDVAVDPRFAENGLIYWSYAEPRDDVNNTAVARGRLVSDSSPPRLEEVQVIWRQTPSLDSGKHFGSRLVFSGADLLFITTGERSIEEGRAQAQRLDSALGKVLRIRRDGTIPDDNPFKDRAGALPAIYSYGHRNVQSAALHPETQELWVVDHGPRGGDEINVVRAGKNYGWPVITYGIEYMGGKVGEGKTAAPGMEQPIYYWDPVIAPSGMAFYVGEAFPAWRGSLFVGALAGKHLARLTLDGTRVIGEERLLVDRARIRDVEVGPGGVVYVLTDEDDGKILKLVPRASKK